MDVTAPASMSAKCKGIFTGGCVERGEGSSFRAKAHAHNTPNDPYYGWICVRSAKRLFNANGAPSQLLWHEYAHLLTPKHHHDNAWRTAMKSLGQPIPAQYQPRRYAKCPDCGFRALSSQPGRFTLKHRDGGGHIFARES